MLSFKKLSFLSVLTHHQCGISSTFSNGCSDTPVILKKNWQSNKTLSNISLKIIKIAYHRQFKFKLLSPNYKLSATFFSILTVPS